MSVKKNDIVQLWVEKYFLEKKDIEVLLLHFLGVSREAFFMLEEVADDLVPQIEAGYKRMMRTEPVQYITQRAPFYSREFFVDSRVLVPRIDTEVLVDKVLEFAKNLEGKSVVCDVWTGSGCIGQSIFLSQNPKNIERLFAFDISVEAIEVAQINAKRFGIDAEVTFFAEGFESFEKHFGESIFSPNIETCIITANLPYIRTVDLWGMESSVFFHEPSVALFWGKQTGFELYERFLTVLKNIKRNYKDKNFVLFMEFWYDQYELSKVFLESMWVKYEHFKDTGGIWRVIQVTF